MFHKASTFPPWPLRSNLFWASLANPFRFDVIPASLRRERAVNKCNNCIMVVWTEKLALSI
jgi:hypothetical protein